MCSQSSNTSSNWHKLHLSSISSSFLRQLHYFSFLGIYGICLVVCSLHLEINLFFVWYFSKFGNYDWMCLLRVSSIQPDMTCGHLALVVHFYTEFTFFAMFLLIQECFHIQDSQIWICRNFWKEIELLGKSPRRAVLLSHRWDCCIPDAANISNLNY